MKKESNYYKFVAIVIVLVGLVLGIILGNVCKVDIDKDIWDSKFVFNIGLMFETWLISDIIAVFFTWMGSVLNKLENIESSICNKLDGSPKVLDNSVLDSTERDVKNTANTFVETKVADGYWDCPKCGLSMSKTNRFCQSCGTSKPK